MHDPSLTGAAPQPDFKIYLLIAVFAIVRFLVRELRERKLSKTQLYVLPSIIWVVAALTIGTAIVSAPGDLGRLAIEAGSAIPLGALVGIAVAHFTTVRLDATGTVFFRGSYVTVGLWVAALALRFGLRFLLTKGAGVADALIANAALVLMLAVALTLVRLRTWLKAEEERKRGVPVTAPAL